MNTPQRYRKRPVQVTAMLFTGDNIDDVLAWINSSGGYAYETIDAEGGYSKITIQTLEGAMACEPGSFAIQGVEGEFYPCAANIFAQTYNPVEDE